jgi:hypothetical protein
MKKRASSFLMALTAAALLSGFAESTAAQRNPTMTQQQRDAEKESYFARFQDHKRIPTGDQQRLAYEDARRYLEMFGGDNDANARAVQKFIVEYEKFTHDYDIFAAYNARDYKKTFAIGRPILQREPDNFYALGVMAEAGYANSLTGDGGLNAETVVCARKAIQLIDAGRVVKSDPFKSIDIARGFLNFALGTLLKDQSPAEAADAFTKAVQTDGPFRTDPVAYHRLGVAILKGEFAQVSAEYNERYGNKPTSPEQQAMFERISRIADRAIDAYARAVALSTSPQQQEAKNKILLQLTTLYKTFHNNSEAGLSDLIETVLSKPLP